MPTIRISPGCMGVLNLAIDLFGIERVDPGSFATPVWVRDLEEEEVEFAREFFAEFGREVAEETDSGILSRVRSLSISQLREMYGLAG